jgi:protocatechuate 3,4-dioxygenase beta subunit
MLGLSLTIMVLAQLPPSTDPKPMPITGVVVDHSGQPVAGADVWLSEANAAGEGRRAGRELGWWADRKVDEETAPILGHARTEATGRFTLELPAEAVARRSPPALVIWAATAGQAPRVAFRRLPRVVLADDSPVRIEPSPPVHAAITVRTPDQKPVAGARVLPSRVGATPIPDPMGRALAGTTDAQGRADLAGLGPAAIARVRVEAAGFGSQLIEILDSGFQIPDPQIQRSPDTIATVALAPSGRVVGRLVAPHGEPIQGVTIRATTRVGGYRGSGIAGTSAVPCDAQGRFEVPAIAAGVLVLELEFNRARGTTLRGEAPQKQIVKAGQTTEVSIPLRPTVAVQGLYREKGTGRPIPGVQVILNYHLGGDRFVVTDATGKFAGRIVREVNQPFGWPVRIPAPFFEPADMVYPGQGMPPGGIEELVLPPIELARGVEVRGSVVGEDHQPVAGAEVEAVWTKPEGLAQGVIARTDHSGGFTLRGVDPLAELNLTAWDGFASTAAVTVRAEAARSRPIALTISPKQATPIGGRVVDSAGVPIAGAAVRVQRQIRAKDGRVMVTEPIANEDGSMVLRTDAEGRYRTRRRFPAHGEAYAEATAPGRLAARSPAIALAEQSRQPPVLVLRRVRDVAGRVVDRQGRPVAGALVRQSGDGPLPTETATAPDGRFQLEGVLEGPVLVFAEKAGYRFGFQPTDDGSKLVEVVLGRTSEPPAVAYHTLPPALPAEEEKALARRLILPCVERILDHGKDFERFRFFRDAAAIDPLAMLERLESLRFAIADLRKVAQVNLAEALAREHLDEATALLEASDAADARALGYLSLCDVRRDLPPARRRELLAQAGMNARDMKSPAYKIMIEAGIAGHWLDLGDTERARLLLQEARALGQDEVKGIKGVNYDLGQVAEVLARLDLPAALKILDDLERRVRQNDRRDRSYVFERFLGHIAHKLAAPAPADAERVLERIPIKQATDRYVVATCAAMATKDLARARRLAESRISREGPASRPHAFGLMAQAIAATNKSGAIRLLDEAYTALDQIASSGDRSSYAGLVQVAAGLLPIVEQLEPDRLAEFLGRTLALRPARGDQADQDDAGSAETTAALAMMAARYDRPLAARLLEPELRQIGSHQAATGWDYVTWRILAAVALVDPRRAVEQVEALPDDPAPGTDPDATKNTARIRVAKLLALHGAERWQYVYEYFLSLWTPDQRYL